jgi:hypothetical protein
MLNPIEKIDNFFNYKKLATRIFKKHTCQFSQKKRLTWDVLISCCSVMTWITQWSFHIPFFFSSLSLILNQQALLWQTFFLGLCGFFLVRFLVEAYWCELSTLLFWLWCKINKRWIEKLWRRDKKAQRWHTWFTITKKSAIKRLKTHFEEIAIYSTIALN